jgi:hypothetical protein
MIVTADPLGDFNATSQILRYSALAREVTVPRIPSIFSNPATAPANTTVFSSSPPLPSPIAAHRPFFAATAGSGSHRTFSPGSPHEGDRATMELAALEIARLTEEADMLRGELGRESEARISAEAHLLSMEDRMLDLEQAVREDCVAEFEGRLAVELARWKASLAIELERGEEHWDRKMGLFERGLGLDDDDGDEGGREDDKENVLVENLEQENERLRRELTVLKRELQCRSPSKRMPLQEREDYFVQQQKGADPGVSSLGSKMERLRVSNESVSSIRSNASGSPKKPRKLGTRKWQGTVEDELMM